MISIYLFKVMKDTAVSTVHAMRLFIGAWHNSTVDEEGAESYRRHGDF